MPSPTPAGILRPLHTLTPLEPIRRETWGRILKAFLPTFYHYCGRLLFGPGITLRSSEKMSYRKNKNKRKMRHIVGPASSGKVWPVFAFIQLSERLNSSFFAVFFALFPKKGILDYIAHLSVPQIRPLRKTVAYLSRLCFPRWHCDSRQHPHC